MKNVLFFRSKEASYNAVVIGSKKSNINNLNNVRHEAWKHFRNKRRKLKLINLKVTVR